MICTDEHVAYLDELLKPYGIHLDDEKLILMLKHLDLVVEKNKVMNLTRIVDPEDAIVRHVVDSLLLLPEISKRIESYEDLSFVDIGTGAGFPGIPLGVALDTNGLLIDSVGKKVNAVQGFIEELGLEGHLSSRAIRAEELARETHGRFGLVTARAVADLGVLVEYASPLLSQGGYLIVSKANISGDEIQRGIKTGELVGLTYVSRETYELPHDMGHREIISFRREGKSKVKLPRQTGMAKHKPLVN